MSRTIKKQTKTHIKVKLLKIMLRCRKSIFRTISSGGSFGSLPFFEIISFSADKFVDLEVYWPVSKSRHVYDKLSVGESYKLYENGLIKKIKQPLQ